MRSTKSSVNTFIADTYALLEIINGSKRYRKYQNQVLLTTSWNLAELYYHLLRTYGKERADKHFKEYDQALVVISLRAIKKSAVFKLKYKSEKLSFVDCMGYVLAKELNLRFLTGDEKFREKENVEFVK